MLLGSNDPLFSRGRGSYANPMHTIGIKDIPTNIKQVMRLCRFYFHQDAALGAIVEKMAEYPVTDLVIEAVDGTLNPDERDRWDRLLNTYLHLRLTLQQMNIGEYCYGNHFLYFYYPFVRYCICQHCQERTQIGALERVQAHPVHRGGKFDMPVTSTCPKCNKKGVFKLDDRKSQAGQNMRLVELAPTRMELEFNPTNGHSIWYWTPPDRMRYGIFENDRSIIDSTEMTVLEAVFMNRRIRVNPRRLWVSQAPQSAGLWDGWGIPPVFRALEDVYYYKILRRANEALAQEHVTPLRIISPANAGEVSPQRTVNLTDLQNRLRAEIQKFKRDPNHIVISPIALSTEQIGGQARVMMVAAECEAAIRMIATALGCPLELVWGGLNWSGASVSLRVLENHFLNSRKNSQRFLDFLVPKLAVYFNLPKVRVTLADFKMADDVQQRAADTNLMVQGFLAREDVLPSMKYDPNRTFERLAKEHKKLNDITMQDNMAASHMQTVIKALEAKADMLLQFELQLAQQSITEQNERKRLQLLTQYADELHTQGKVSPIELDQSAALLARLDPMMLSAVMGKWGQTMPYVSALLMSKLQTMQPAQIPMDPNAAAANAGGAQQTGTSGAPDPGAQGPYGGGGAPEDGGGSNEDTSGGDPLPEQQPPSRQGGSPM